MTDSARRDRLPEPYPGAPARPYMSAASYVKVDRNGNPVGNAPPGWRVVQVPSSTRSILMPNPHTARRGRP